MGYGTALAKHARLSPYGEARRRRIFARPRASAPAARRSKSERKALASSQYEFDRKPLKRPDSREKQLGFRFPWLWISFLMIWMFLPRALEILERPLSTRRGAPSP
jgi:hypothetical protein